MRLPQFTIRDLLWLMVVCAVLILAYSDRLKTRQRIAEAEASQAQERVALEKSRAELERQRRLQETHFEEFKKEADLLKKQTEVLKELQAQDAELRQRFPQVFPARNSPAPKRIE